MKNMFSLKNTSPAPAVDRAMAILNLLAQSPEPLGVSAIARALDIGKSTTHGILKALLTAEAIEDAGERRFRLGPLVEKLAGCRRGRRTLADICRPHLARLVDQTGQTCIFGLVEEDRFRIVTVVEGRGPLQVKAAEGRSIPVLAGAVGKIALAWAAVAMPETLPQFTSDSVTDAKILNKELVRVRSDQLALDRGEYLRGVYAAASPIQHRQKLQGILFSAGFQDQLGEEGLLSLGRAVKLTAQVVSEELS